MAKISQRSSIEKTVNSMKYERTFKVIVIGDANVGKTALTYRFCEGKFLSGTEATIGVDFRSKTLNLDDEIIKLVLWDTAGQERHRNSMIPYYYRNAAAVVLVYDVTNPASFASLKTWINEFKSNCLLDLPKILIGNKCDGDVMVSSNDAQKFADEYDMPLFETSAKLDSHCDNVEAIFQTLAYKLKSQKPFISSERESIRLGAEVVKDTTKQSSSWWCC